MPESGSDLWKDFGVLLKGLHKSMVSISKLTAEKKKNIADELKQIPPTHITEILAYLSKEHKKNLDLKNDVDIRKELGEKNFNLYIDSYFEDIEEYIIRLITLYQQKLPAPSDLEDKSDNKASLHLSDIFESISKYNHIMRLFVEKGYCQQNTFIWKDQDNGNKSFLAAIIKHLHKLGYYKNNKCPTSEQIQVIAQCTFSREISIDTIKKVKPDRQFNLDFIPLASTLS
jgi:hypothetical protein